MGIQVDVLQVQVRCSCMSRVGFVYTCIYFDVGYMHIVWLMMRDRDIGEGNGWLMWWWVDTLYEYDAQSDMWVGGGEGEGDWRR